MTRLFAIAALLACCAIPAVAAGSAKRPRGLWATINICDTDAHPNTIGIRASMPGDGQHSRMYMRFADQYYSASKQAWLTVQRGPWQSVGSGIYARRESGRSFEITPDPGTSYEMRGLVDFRWTLHGHTIRSYQLVTRRGHHGTMGADPRGYSASLCTIS